MDKVFLTPEEYSKRSGLKVDHVRWLCRTGQLENIRTEGGAQYSHYKIPIRELTKFEDQKSLDNGSYEALLKENERLRTILNMIVKMIEQIDGGIAK